MLSKAKPLLDWAMEWKNQLTRTPYLVLFIVLISIGVGSVSAGVGLPTITLSGNPNIVGFSTFEDFVVVNDFLRANELRVGLDDLTDDLITFSGQAESLQWDESENTFRISDDFETEGDHTINGVTISNHYFDVDNTSTGLNAIALGGAGNQATGDNSTIGGGADNTALPRYSTIGGGSSNSIIGHVNLNAYSTIGGGRQNTVDEYASTIGGGWNNMANGSQSTIGGGRTNLASGAFATVAGGQQATAEGNESFVGGGLGNEALGARSVVAGGSFNTASGDWSSIPGGSANIAGGFSSFAAGTDAHADHDGTFVWSGSSFNDFSSTGTEQFLIDAPGGVGIGINNPLAQLHVSGGCIGCMKFYQLTQDTGLLVTGTNTYSCNNGDLVISGGGWVPGTTAWLRESWAVGLDTWKIHFTDVNGAGVKPGAFVITCADINPND